jgi:hypothetical protein
MNSFGVANVAKERSRKVAATMLANTSFFEKGPAVTQGSGNHLLLAHCCVVPGG